MDAPPDYVIEAARLAAVQSPCAKSKRGVALFNSRWAAAFADTAALDEETRRVAGRRILRASAFNGPPAGFECKDSWVCRGSCSDVCIHAEQRAILAALGSDDVRDLELVHVKVVDGLVVAGGPPSCLQCSKLVVEVGLRCVWLLEATRWHDEVPCDTCNAKTAIAQGDATDGVCKRCKSSGRLPGLLELGHAKTIYESDSGLWRFYSASNFHEATLANNGISSLGAEA